jgi:hypothetical protein
VRRCTNDCNSDRVNSEWYTTYSIKNANHIFNLEALGCTLYRNTVYQYRSIPFSSSGYGTHECFLKILFCRVECSSSTAGGILLLHHVLATARRACQVLTLTHTSSHTSIISTQMQSPNKSLLTTTTYLPILCYQGREGIHHLFSKPLAPRLCQIRRWQNLFPILMLPCFSRC